MIRETYLNRAARDARAKELKAQGLQVKRRATGPCQLHPMYVKDFEGQEKNETGFGNTVYKTYFGNLYQVEAH